MSQIIGDVGGSSSRWALISPGSDPRYFEGLPGYNPSTGDPDGFMHALRERFGAIPDALRVEAVRIYGAGCGTEDRKQRMRSALLKVWPGLAHMVVDTDLLGAAHGLCGDQPGLVLILGTGMNVGVYDGASLSRPMPSLGFILGDEGSGADIGRHLLRDALYGSIPKDTLGEVFPDGLMLDEVIERTYRSPSPQAYLASCTARLADLMDDGYVRDLIRSRFTAMVAIVERFFTQEQRTNVCAVGSVAWGFRALLEEVLAARGMQLSVVERDPLRGMVKYHLRRSR